MPNLYVSQTHPYFWLIFFSCICSSVCIFWATIAVYSLEIWSKILTEKRNGRSMWFCLSDFKCIQLVIKFFKIKLITIYASNSVHIFF